MARILVVDDDEDLAQTIQMALKPFAEIRCAHSISDSKKALLDFRPDLLIVDYQIGSETGFSLIQESLQIHPAPKTILITAFAEKDMAIEALHLRVYSFLEKPFSLDELRSRVKAALIGDRIGSDFKIDEQARQVIYKGTVFDLTTIEMKIFLRLMSHLGKVVSREDLNRWVWGENRISSHALDTHLSNLKKKSLLMRMSIKVIWGYGYIMERVLES